MMRSLIGSSGLKILQVEQASGRAGFRSSRLQVEQVCIWSVGSSFSVVLLQVQAAPHPK